MHSTAPIDGAYDSITAQGTFAVAGNGSMNFVGIPQQQAAGSRAFKVLTAALFIFSDNSNGTLDAPYPTPSPATEGVLFVIPSSVNPVGTLSGVGLVNPFPLASLGTGVTMREISQNASAGNNQSLWIMDSTRDVIVPFGYKFGVWVRDSNDGTPHNLTITLICQIQWLEPDCGC